MKLALIAVGRLKDGPERELVERDGERATRIDVAGAAAYEIGMRETDHGIPLQPFADG